MKELSIHTTIKVFDSPEELMREDAELLASAAQATEGAYVPYSKFKVGCAVLLENGETISGSNQENASFPVGICAERVTLSAVSSQYPGVAPVKLAISLKNDNKPSVQPSAPCGVCRQTISEYENRFGKPIRLIMRGESGPIYIIDSVKDILPLSFGASDFLNV